jgi:hypothetical protein
MSCCLPALKLPVVPGHPSLNLLEVDVFAVWEKDLADKVLVSFFIAALETYLFCNTRVLRSAVDSDAKGRPVVSVRQSAPIRPSAADRLLALRFRKLPCAK